MFVPKHVMKGRERFWVQLASRSRCNLTKCEEQMDHPPPTMGPSIWSFDGFQATGVDRVAKWDSGTTLTVFLLLTFLGVLPLVIYILVRLGIIRIFWLRPRPSHLTRPPHPCTPGGPARSHSVAVPVNARGPNRQRGATLPSTPTSSRHTVGPPTGPPTNSSSFAHRSRASNQQGGGNRSGNGSEGRQGGSNGRDPPIGGNGNESGNVSEDGQGGNNGWDPPVGGNGDGSGNGPEDGQGGSNGWDPPIGGNGNESENRSARGQGGNGRDIGGNGNGSGGDRGNTDLKHQEPAAGGGNSDGDDDHDLEQETVLGEVDNNNDWGAQPAGEGNNIW